MPWMKVECLPYLDPLQTTVLHQGRNYGHFGFGGWRSEERSLLSWISYWGRCSTVNFRLKLKAWSSNSKGQYQILSSCVRSVSVRDNPFTCTSTAELRSTVRKAWRNKQRRGILFISLFSPLSSPFAGCIVKQPPNLWSSTHWIIIFTIRITFEHVYIHGQRRSDMVEVY